MCVIDSKEETLKKYPPLDRFCLRLYFYWSFWNVYGYFSTELARKNTKNPSGSQNQRVSWKMCLTVDKHFK